MLSQRCHTTKIADFTDAFLLKLIATRQKKKNDFSFAHPKRFHNFAGENIIVCSMKKNISKHVVALIAVFGMSHFYSPVYATELPVVFIPNDDDHKDDYPHRSPQLPTDAAAYAVYQQADTCLSIIFAVSDPAVCINIYKGETIVISTLKEVRVGDAYDYSLTNYGAGSYRIELTMIEEEEPLIGYFTIQ